MEAFIHSSLNDSSLDLYLDLDLEFSLKEFDELNQKQKEALEQLKDLGLWW